MKYVTIPLLQHLILCTNNPCFPHTADLYPPIHRKHILQKESECTDDGGKSTADLDAGGSAGELWWGSWGDTSSGWLDGWLGWATWSTWSTWSWGTSWGTLASGWVNGRDDSDGTSSLGWLNNPDNWGSEDDGGNRLDDGSGCLLDDGGAWESDGGVGDWEWSNSWGWVCRLR